MAQPTPTIQPARTLPKDPGNVTALRVAKGMTWLVYAYFIVAVIVLTLAFFLLLFNASTTADFTQWVYRSADRALEPFRGIFPTHEADNGSVIDFAILFAIIMYGIIAMLLQSLISWIDRKIQEERAKARWLASAQAPPAQGAPDRLMAATVLSGSGNPALSEKVSDQYLIADTTARKTMSVAGVAGATLLLLVVLVAGGAWGWASATQPVATDLGSGYANTTVTIPGGFWLASFGAFFVGIMLVTNPRRAALLGVVYAVLEGYVLGAISAMFDAQTEGIVGAAVLATIAVFCAALFLYATRLIRPTQKMAFGVAAGIGGLCLLYLFVWVVSIFNWAWLYSDQFRTIGIVVSLLAVVLAALSLTLDFATIEAGVKAGAPRFMDWYVAYGLMVTLVWLYITLLRLLALLTRNQ